MGVEKKVGHPNDEQEWRVSNGNDRRMIASRRFGWWNWEAVVFACPKVKKGNFDSADAQAGQSACMAQSNFMWQRARMRAISPSGGAHVCNSGAGRARGVVRQMRKVSPRRGEGKVWVRSAADQRGRPNDRSLSQRDKTDV